MRRILAIATIAMFVLTVTASAAPRYKKNGAMLTEGPAGITPIAGHGTLRYQTVTGGTFSYECRNAMGGSVWNSENSGVGSIELLSTYACTFSACPTFGVLMSESLPWSMTLEPGYKVKLGTEPGNPMKVSFECWPNRAEQEKIGGAPNTRTAYVGFPSPKVENGTSATTPSRLRFGTETEVEQEGSNGTIKVQFLGSIPFVGYEKEELVSVQ
jgi:hypothetical protein